MRIEPTKGCQTPKDIRNNYFLAQINNKKVVILKQTLYYLVADSYGIDLEWILNGYDLEWM